MTLQNKVLQIRKLHAHAHIRYHLTVLERFEEKKYIFKKKKRKSLINVNHVHGKRLHSVIIATSFIVYSNFKGPLALQVLRLYTNVINVSATFALYIKTAIEMHTYVLYKLEREKHKKQ